MRTKIIRCACCHDRMFIDEAQYTDKRGSFICEKCYLKNKLEVEKKSVVGDVPDYTIPLGTKGVPIRNHYDSLTEYAIDYLYAVVGSDLHLKAGAYPVFRKGGRLYRISDEKLTDADIVKITKKYYKGFGNVATKSLSLDFSFYYKDARFRANFFHDNNGSCLALRLIKLFSLDFNKLGLPEIIKDIATKRSGLILVTGPTGSGKTTSLAAVINYLNTHSSNHIITLEDPIEYIHENLGCIISQREIGRDVDTYENGIIELLREDPDIVMIGEMRDKASIESTLRAVETGHIVFSTLHTRGSVSTITRIVDTFPAIEQDAIRSQLANCLLACLSQQLVPAKTKGEVCLATELMINNTPISSAIRTNKLTMIPSLIQMGQAEGMHTMRASLDKLLNAGKIDQKFHDEYMI